MAIKSKQREQIKRLKRMKAEDLQTYFRLTDPNNQFIRQVTLGGTDGLKQLQRQQIWKSIQSKYETSKDTNDFLNNLTEDEFVEYISESPGAIDDTGRQDISVKVGT